mmetsp:Transcript_8562/g.21288  ORF Transcript_8562/g.21288 Transcript_8562/m.21288 type:complete len:419 (+) Transcript_8562:572-1828(+)
MKETKPQVPFNLPSYSPPPHGTLQSPPETPTRARLPPIAPRRSDPRDPTATSSGLLPLARLRLGGGVGADDLGGSVAGAVIRSRGELLIDLALDPEVGGLEAVGQSDLGGPSEHLAAQVVVGVAAADALGPRNVVDLELLVLEGHDELRHVVHGDHLLGADVEGLGEVGEHELDDAVDGVVDVAERACLLAVAPHLELRLRGDALAAEGGGGLLAAALPGAEGPVDVVEAADAGLHAEVLAVVDGELLRGELLEAVGVLGLCRPGVGLLEARVVGLELGALGVDAGGGGVVEALDGLAAGGLDHVEGDHGVVVEDDGVVGLDEAHAAHVGGEVVDVLDVLAGLHAVGHLAEVHEEELVAELLALEVLVLLPVRGDDVEAVGHELFGEVGRDETTGAGDENAGLFGHVEVGKEEVGGEG